MRGENDMKKRLQGLVAGILIGVMLTGGVVFAKQATETISVIYDNIRILIDGKEYQPTDANGDAVEPFAYNGTTYLPVRAIANAFDKDVDWEAQTSTVTLGSKNYDWLDQMGYVDYKTTHPQSTMKAIAEGTKDSSGVKFDRGLQFTLRADKYMEDNDGSIYSYQTVEYLLNNSYKTFSGNFISLCSAYGQSVIVKFYGDGQLIYTSPVISYGTKATKFDVDISNYKILKMHIEIPNLYYGNFPSDVGIADARLSKK